MEAASGLEQRVQEECTPPAFLGRDWPYSNCPPTEAGLPFGSGPTCNKGELELDTRKDFLSLAFRKGGSSSPAELGGEGKGPRAVWKAPEGRGLAAEFSPLPICLGPLLVNPGHAFPRRPLTSRPLPTPAPNPKRGLSAGPALMGWRARKELLRVPWRAGGGWGKGGQGWGQGCGAGF